MKHYSQQFKDEAVALALESDFPQSQIAKDLGINYQTFSNWIRQVMFSKLSKSAKTPINQQDHKALERELKAARKELELRKRRLQA